VGRHAVDRRLGVADPGSFDPRVLARRISADGTLATSTTTVNTFLNGTLTAGIAPRIAARPGTDRALVTWNHSNGERPIVYARA
jgi:hypothetical protein